VEGGCIIANNEEYARKLYLFRQFGHVYDDYFSVGINAKNSEFHAAMGLAVLPKLPGLIAARKKVYDRYTEGLNALGSVLIPSTDIPAFQWNYAYYPVVFETEQDLLKVRQALADKGIFTRRYFYPSLNELSFVEKPASCPVSEDISRRVLCLPFYPDLETEIIDEVVNIFSKTLATSLKV
jgi:dTDP-4-amino-4,6-dideoxygalactose transaminase